MRLNVGREPVASGSVQTTSRVETVEQQDIYIYLTELRVNVCMEKVFSSDLMTQNSIHPQLSQQVSAVSIALLAWLLPFVAVQVKLLLCSLPSH